MGLSLLVVAVCLLEPNICASINTLFERSGILLLHSKPCGALDIVNGLLGTTFKHPPTLEEQALEACKNGRTIGLKLSDLKSALDGKIPAEVLHKMWNI